jgi:hypothetical protein
LRPLSRNIAKKNVKGRKMCISIKTRNLATLLFVLIATTGEVRKAYKAVTMVVKDHNYVGFLYQ